MRDYWGTNPLTENEQKQMGTDLGSWHYNDSAELDEEEEEEEEDRLYKIRPVSENFLQQFKTAYKPPP
jgi:hypothetical protein